MCRGRPHRVVLWWSMSIALLFASVTGLAQPGRGTALGDGPWLYKTPDAEFRVVAVTRQLANPWSLAFLPDGDILVTERPGRLRVVHHGLLNPNAVAGVPDVYAVRLDGLLDIALHPRFSENKLVYLSYSKPGPDLPPGAEMLGSRLPDLAQKGSGKTMSDAIVRARWDGTALTDARDIFVDNNLIDDSISQTSAVRLAFGRDGMLYMGAGAANAPASTGPLAKSRGGRAQDPQSHGGKILRLRDDGTVPKDNPFVGRSGYKPEIFTLGHRNVLGLAVNPDTGALWEHENGPQDGDEINVLKAGANYGWPVVGLGRDYSGDFIGGRGAIGETAGRADAFKYYLPNFEQPIIFWAPAVAPSGMAFYSGDRFPKWKGSLFVGVLKYGRLERHVFNQQGQLIRREYLLEDLKQRIRDVRVGPDGLVYVLTDQSPGALLRIEPAQGVAAQ